MLSLKWSNIAKQFFKKYTLTTTVASRKIETAKIENEQNENKIKIDEKDRSRIISVETSIKYLKSPAFFESYGGELVWKLHRRNFKGSRAPKTRRTCIRKKRISTGSPCPICRDEYLVVDYRNVELLKQFVSSYNNVVLPSIKTGICQMQYKKLLVAVEKAKDYGFLKFDVPHRLYNYGFYHKKDKLT